MTSISDISRWEIRVEVYQDRVEEILDIPDPAKSIRRKPRTKVWHVERLLDSGAFGDVRLEKSMEDGKLRAVKKIPLRSSDLSNDKYKEELQALVEFSKPEFRKANVFVEFFGFFKSNSDVFLAMEYIPLGNLEKNVGASRTVPEAEARDIVGQILFGLEIMHAQSFAHRDLKPQNVLVVDGPPKWLIKLADFGLTKRLTESTVFETKIGTPLYMAPEILDYIETDSPNGEYTNAVDLWSVGCIAYRIITGNIPFRPERLVNYCRDKSQFPSSHLHDVGIRAGSACSKFIRELLSADPTERPSASQALNNWWIISATSSKKSLGNLSNRRSPETTQVSTIATNFNTGSHDGLKSYDSSSNLPSVSGNLTIRKKSLPPLPSEPILAPPTFESAIFALKIFKEHRYPVLSVSFSPDGKTLASTAGDTVLLCEVETGNVICMLGNSAAGSDFYTGTIWAAAFSPNGKMVATALEKRSVQVWDVATGDLLQTFKGHGMSVRCVAFSSDSKVVASGSADQTVRLWDMATGASLQIIWGHTGWVRSIAISPDCKVVASGSDDRTVRICNTATGDTIAILQGHRTGIWAVNFSHDGKLLALATEDGTIQIRDMSAGKTVQTLNGHIRTVRHVAFTQDGKLLASASEDLTVRVWDLATGIAQVFVGHSRWIYWVAISPDEKVMASASEDKTIRLWDLESIKYPLN